MPSRLTVRYQDRLALFLFVLLLAITLGRPFLQKIDAQYFEYSIRDFVGWLDGESWSEIEGVSFSSHGSGFSSSRRISVGHALGARNTLKENSYEAFVNGLDAGFLDFELDLFVTRDGTIACGHDFPLEKSVCNPNLLLAESLERGAHLIIDVKGEFEDFLNALSVAESDIALWRNVTLQLYKPEDVNLFFRFKHKNVFNRPIVSVYKSFRKTEHICAAMKRTGLTDLVVPVQKLHALGTSCRSFRIFAHPINSCEQLKSAEVHAELSGIYTNERLFC